MTDDPTRGRRILVTGGSGTFGKAMVRRLLAHHKPQWVAILSRDELKQFEMRQEPWANDDRLRMFLGDIRDRERLYRAFDNVDIVIHAAALKQVPAGEYNPCEFVKTNVLGPMNIVDAAIDRRVSKVLALSTDKACAPVTLYGQTKAVMERLICASNSYSGASGTRFSCVRYGNVAGSRGSIIPHWRDLIARGQPLSITHPEMTRFYMRLEQAVDFVIRALSEMQGGEVFVPKLPSFRVTDLARAMGRESWLVSGLRPGEKLAESMIDRDESPWTKQLPWAYAINGRDGTPVAPGMEYSSDNNRMLTIGELQSELACV